MDSIDMCWRQIFALIYDSLIMISVWMLAALIALWLNHGHLFGHLHIGFLLYLWVVGLVLNAWCWVKKGQTLGMLAWKIKVVSATGQRLNYHQAFLRYVWATLNVCTLGIGWLWSFFDMDQQTLHSRLSKTRIVKI